MTLSKLSEQGHTADALAPRADEGRGKLRKGMVQEPMKDAVSCEKVW